jgi:putative two-component system response regulator
MPPQQAVCALKASPGSPPQAPRGPSPRPTNPEADRQWLQRQSQIMIVDDELINIKVTQRYLEKDGYLNFIPVTDATRVMDLIQVERPDLILLDVVMPRVSGLDILQQLRADPETAGIPVVILTASVEPDIKQRALSLGATDFLAKPVDASELVPRVKNVLTVKSHQDHLERYTEELEEAVRMRTYELAMSRKQVIQCLARAAEYRDDDTGKHIIRVGRYARMIAEQLGFSVDDAELVEQAAQLHDVGKIAIPDAILKKPGKLDPDEYDYMKRHCLFGRRIIEPYSDFDREVLRNHPDLGARILNVETSPVIQLAAKIALTHHERWDGTGYPLGLAGEDIPIEGRITAVADVFDALSSARPYKQPFPREKCFQILRADSGSHFDPRVIEAFFQRAQEIVATQIEYADIV